MKYREGMREMREERREKYGKEGIGEWRKRRVKIGEGGKRREENKLSIKKRETKAKHGDNGETVKLSGEKKRNILVIQTGKEKRGK